MPLEIVTFGCRLNTYESEVMRREAEAAGLGALEHGAVIFNTCAVTSEAVRQAKQSIRKARRENPDARIIVTGCAAQTDPAAFADMAEVDLVLGTPGGPTIITTVAQVLLAVVDQGMSLADAVTAPRIHHQALPDTIRYERGGLTPGTLDALRALGHATGERSGTSGIVTAIARGPAGGWVGVADPRYLGGAAGY